MTGAESARVVAIDGPAASGKSTVARQVAWTLGDIYVDSGALYRGITLAVLRRGRDVRDANAVTELLPALSIDFLANDGAVVFVLDGERPGDALRSQAVSGAVSPVAAIAAVRRQVVAWLRAMTRFGNLVMEGRDIGTVVFPDTPHKFYLDASPEERVRRRYREDLGREETISREAVLANVAERDRIDSSRQVDPLRIAPDALVIDTTGLTIDAVAACIVKRIPYVSR